MSPRARSPAPSALMQSRRCSARRSRARCRWSRLDATVLATLLAFLIAPAVTVWAYLARGPWRAVVGVIGLAALLAGIAWYAGPPA